MGGAPHLDFGCASLPLGSISRPGRSLALSYSSQAMSAERNTNKAYAILGIKPGDVQRSRALVTLGASIEEYENRFEGDRDMSAYDMSARLLPSKALRVLGHTSESFSRVKALSVLGVTEDELTGAVPETPRRRGSSLIKTISTCQCSLVCC